MILRRWKKQNGISTDKKEADLRRFRAYEAVFSHQQGKDVITYVIYSGGVLYDKAWSDDI